MIVLSIKNRFLINDLMFDNLGIYIIKNYTTVLSIFLTNLNVLLTL